MKKKKFVAKIKMFALKLETNPANGAYLFQGKKLFPGGQGGEVLLRIPPKYLNILWRRPPDLLDSETLSNPAAARQYPPDLLDEIEF